jgi:hydroxymethylglutaryl-CoA lyase
MGFNTGLDVMKIIEAGKRAEEILGQPLRSNVIRCGPVSHEATPAEKGEGSKIAEA